MAAKKYDKLNVQCVLKNNFVPVFSGKNHPELKYIAQIQPQKSAHPRIMHSHEDFTELVLIFEGSSDYLIHDQKYHVEAGDLLIYNPKIIHDEISSAANEVGSYCIAIGGLHMKGLRDFALIPDDVGFIFKTGEDFATLQTMLLMMYEDLLHNKKDCEPFCHAMTNAFLTKALAIVERQTKMGITSQKTDNSEIVLGREIQEYIDLHYKERVTLERIGKDLHVSPYYVGHVFKQVSGYSPMQYLLRRRIGEAQNLLISTDMPLVEIAGELGYDSQSYFNSQFTKLVGMPPKRYRNSYLAGREVYLEAQI